jgi:predicted nucleotidyltransferase
MNIALLEERLAPVFEKHKISEAILFGSFARGENTSHSDVDLILIKRTRKRFFDRFEPILVELNAAIPEYAVDVLIYTHKELDSISHRPFIKRALREGKILYKLEKK